MITEDTAKGLIVAMNRLSSAIEKAMEPPAPVVDPGNRHYPYQADPYWTWPGYRGNTCGGPKF